MGTLNAAPFGGNILATGAVEGALYHTKPAIPEVVAAVQRMEARCAELGVPIATAALALSYAEPRVDVTVLGTVTRQEVEANVRAFACPLTRAELESIAAAGRIDEALLGGPSFTTSAPDPVGDRMVPPGRA